ncbi:ExeA family protein [Aeoliella mucimassa]|uniref:ATPase family associated with various cellular activities (AAA) n=1 Tax=Aeoliella mucimassa TaxID=2527972 RepID=A0A518AI86_9BACT|nr:AAA family ATPase [Aeoliella mucimassa]QDU54430.1 ATPase family associated with various cellular activities (AAA) [Aeoliella mucimassa]
MYLEHWQLADKPFEPAADERFYFASQTHQGAMLKLRYALENGRGAALIAGPSGVGKTLLVEQLLAQLPASFVPVVHLVYPQMPAREMLAYLAARIAPNEDPQGLTPSVDQSWRRLEESLQGAAERDERPVVVVDEAHLLEDAGTLETVRLLLNLQQHGSPLLSIVMVGQPPLLSTLSRTPRLEERLDISALVEPLTVDETASYLQHRLAAAGAERNVLTDGAVDTLHQLAHGVPRRLNRLGDLALLVGYANGASMVDTELVRSVANELAFARAA